MGQVSLINTFKSKWDKIFPNNKQATHRQLKNALITLENRDRLLHTVNRMAELFLSVEDGYGFRDATRRSMETIGLCLNADRVSLMLIDVNEHGVKINLDNQWTSEFGGQTQKMNLSQRIPSGALPICEKIIFSGKPYNAPMSDLPENERLALDPSGAIISIVIIPIIHQNQLWGIFSIDNCTTENILTVDEMDILRSASLMIASAYRHVGQKELEHEIKEAEVREKKVMAEMQRLEVAEENNRAKSKFLARMSHEIRTPITAVMGISEIQLQDPYLQPQVVEAFAKIHSSSQTLLGIINDMLDLSKIEAGKMELVYQEYDTASMISNVAHMHFGYVGSKDIKFELSVDENMPACLIGDALRTAQIMNNLLSNAFKYTESGSVTLSLKWDDANLTIAITDTGLGMTPDQLEILATDYTRFHEHQLKHVQGTGLGMSIVYSLAHLMNAQIELKSEVNAGTSVTVCIPQKAAVTEVLGPELSRRLQNFEEDTNTKDFKFTPELMPYGKVLVVDDIDANLYVAQGLLAFYDINVEACKSGYEAIAKVNQGNEYDIIFMDQMMPGMDGTETMRSMRDLGYKKPIVALTANALIGQAEEFIKNGFDDFISKPIQTTHLNTILIKYIKGSQKTSSTNQTKINDYQNSPELLDKLRQDFVKNHKRTFLNITDALKSNDTKTAHRLAHSLKGLAGLLKEPTLSLAAKRIEHKLERGQSPTEAMLLTLKTEFTRVLNNIEPPEAPIFSTAKDFDKNKVEKLLDTLEVFLKTYDAQCLDYIDELRLVPETAILIRQIEDFDFEFALTSTGTLRAILLE